MKSRDIDTAYAVLEDCLGDDKLSETAQVLDLLETIGLGGDRVDGMRRIVRALELLADSVADATSERDDKRLAGLLHVLGQELDRRHL